MYHDVNEISARTQFSNLFHNFPNKTSGTERMTILQLWEALGSEDEIVQLVMMSLPPPPPYIFIIFYYIAFQGQGKQFLSG